jgi:hypothetical protein
MITVTAADSKYSRQTDFGGPFGLVSGSGGCLCPLRLKIREKADVFGSTFVSVTLGKAGPLKRLLIIFKSS